MNEQLLQEIEQLEHQSKLFAEQRDAATEDNVKLAFQAEINAVNVKIEQRRQQIDAVATDVQETQSAILDAFGKIEIDGVGYSLSDFTTSPEAAQFLSAWFQSQVGDIAQKYSAQAQSYKQENDELRTTLGEKERTITVLRTDNDRLGLANADLQAKRDAAAEVIEEHEATIKRLNEDITSLRENVGKPTQTNSNTNLGELMKAALEKRPAIYNLRWEDENNRKSYLAELAATSETIRFGFLELGKYRQITPDEASQFREASKDAAEAEEAEPVQADAVQDSTLGNGVEPPSLPSENGLELAEDNASVPVAGKTLEERIEALEAAVFGK